MNEVLEKKEKVHLYGRRNWLNSLENDLTKVEVPINQALIGAEGFGKEAIIDALFSINKRIEYLKKNKVLAVIITPKKSVDMKGFFSYLFLSLMEKMEVLEEIDPIKYQKICDAVQKKKNDMIRWSMEGTIDDASAERILDATLDILLKNGIKVVFVFKNFDKLAQQSQLVSQQYIKVRDLATVGNPDDPDHGKLCTLFVTSSEKMSKISEDIATSNLEGIFTSLRSLEPIRDEDVGKWINQELDETYDLWDLEDWILTESGGIPGIIEEAINIVKQCWEEKQEFETQLFSQKLQEKVEPLMKKWWDKVDDKELLLLRRMAKGEVIEATRESRGIMERGCLVLRNGVPVFVNAVFERYVKQQIALLEEEESKQREKEEREHQIEEEKQKREEEEKKRQEEESREQREEIKEIKKMLLLSLLREMPSKKEFNEPEEFVQAVEKHTQLKFHEIGIEDLQEKFNISTEIWNGLSAALQNNLRDIYRLRVMIYNDDIRELDEDCSPIMAMIGKFLEGYLNNKVKNALIRVAPNVIVRPRKGQDITARKATYLGEFQYLLLDPNVQAKIEEHDKATELKLTANIITSLGNKLDKCRSRRNDADHQVRVVTYQNYDECFRMMFGKSDNNMMNVIHRISKL